MDVVQSLRAIVGNDGVLDAKETATRAAGVMRIPIEAVIRTRVPRLAAKAMQILNSAAIRR